MNTINIQDYVTQPAVNEAYSASLVDIKDASNVPDSLEPGQVLKNSTDQTIMFGGGTSAVGWITVMEDKEYDSIKSAEELNMMDVKGALFSWNASTGKYHVWNAGEVKVWDYTLDCSEHYNPGSGSPSVPSWDADVEFPENEYGEVIAVCAGKGIWVSTKWPSATNRMWCSQDSPLCNFQWDCFDLNGAEVAKKLYAKDLTGSMFADVKVFESIEGDGTLGHWFVPSRSEIFQVICACADEHPDADLDQGEPAYTYTNAYYNATHILALSAVWSCSQNVNYSSYAYNLDYADNLDSSSKDDECTCAVCLRFGESLDVNPE